MAPWLSQAQTQTFFMLLLISTGLGSLLSLLFFTLRRRHRLQQFNLSQSRQRYGTVVRILGKLSPDKEELQKKFVAAGVYATNMAGYYRPLKYITLIAGLVVIGLGALQLSVSPASAVICAALWKIIVLIGPDAYLSARSKQLQRKISGQLPYLLDLMAICVQTGMSIEASINYLSEEMQGFDADISHMLNKVNERAKIVGLEQALDDLYIRVPSSEMRSFVMTLKQSLQYGSSIYQLLTTLSADIRAVQMLNVEEKIGKMAAKMSIPLILFIMVPIVILIAAPGVMRMMNGV